jgi:bacterioferritin-associated ferredoxin
LYACICHAVTDVEVGAAVATGAGSVKAIRQTTGAGASCGSCVKRLSCLLSTYKESAADPQADAPVPAGATGPVRPRSGPRAQPRPAPTGGHLLGCPAAAPALG